MLICALTFSHMAWNTNQNTLTNDAYPKALIGTASGLPAPDDAVATSGNNCPTLITGKGAGTKLGGNIGAPKNRPLSNAWLTLLRGSGVPAESFSDSTGPLREIVA